MHENQITSHVISAAMKVHSALGPGLFESVYERVLARELELRRLRVARQRALPVIYEDVHMEYGFRVDLVVHDLVLVEIKSLEALAPVHAKQLLTYLRLANKRVGLLLNFGAYAMREGIRRVVNRFEP